MENASGYIDELNLTSSNPTTRLGLYLLGLEGVSSEGAVFTLSKFGWVVDRVIVSEGEVVSMKFEDGGDGVEFRLVEAVNGSTGSMVAALSVRNHLRPGSWSLPLDFVAAGCGIVIFAAGLALGQTEMVTRGMLLAGVGFMLVIAREHDRRVNALLMRGSPIHDFIGLILIFFSASYLTLLLPEKWNMMVTLGTLITYYTLINLHGERAGG